MRPCSTIEITSSSGAVETTQPAAAARNQKVANNIVIFMLN
jgi:hypothetical protein